MDTILLLICDPIPVLSFCLSNVLECISPSSPGFIQELHVMFSRLISSVSFNVGQFFSLSLSLPHWHIWWTRPFILQNAPQFGFVWCFHMVRLSPFRIPCEPNWELLRDAPSPFASYWSFWHAPVIWGGAVRSFLAQQNVPVASCSFPTSALESATSLSQGPQPLGSNAWCSEVELMS